MTAPSFTCPRCGRTSHHPDDARNGYCGACHDYTGDATLIDTELRVLQSVIWLMRKLPENRRMAVLDYLTERATAEGTPDPHEATRRTLAHGIHADIAAVIARSDGRDWEKMDAVAQSPYYRRAAAVTTWAHDQEGNPR